MANIVTRQVLLDGQRNAVIKLSGILDTADIAATGQIGASGFTTTLGANTIAFVAGALAPVVGQYVTFSDVAATFPAGTYITSITDATHIVVNNAALKTNAAAAVTITGTAGAVVLVDPAMLNVMGGNSGACTRVVVDKITYNIESALAVNLYWEATANDLLAGLVTSGDTLDATDFGGIYNTEQAGVTGKLVWTTQGWSAGAVLSFNVVLKIRKK